MLKDAALFAAVGDSAAAGEALDDAGDPAGAAAEYARALEAEARRAGDELRQQKEAMERVVQMHNSELAEAAARQLELLDQEQQELLEQEQQELLEQVHLFLLVGFGLYLFDSNILDQVL